MITIIDTVPDKGGDQDLGRRVDGDLQVDDGRDPLVEKCHQTDIGQGRLVGEGHVQGHQVGIIQGQNSAVCLVQERDTIHIHQQTLIKATTVMTDYHTHLGRLRQMWCFVFFHTNIYGEDSTMKAHF